MERDHLSLRRKKDICSGVIRAHFISLYGFKVDLKAKRDKTRLDRDKPRGGITMFTGWCASKVHLSVTLVEIVDGELCNSKGTRDLDRLEITKVPGNGHSGIRASPPEKVSGFLLVQQKCIYSNACSTGSKEEKLEAIVQQENWRSCYH